MSPPPRRHRLAFCLLLALLAPSGALARPFEGLARRDQLALLYRPQFQFTREGEPLVSVGLKAGAASATFGGPSGVRLLPAGEDGVELPVAPGEHVRVRVARAKPARIHYWAALRLGGADARRTAKTLTTWTARAFKPRHFDVGGVLGLEGRLLDNRATVIGLERHDTQREAKEAAARIRKKHGGKISIYEELRAPPTGVLEIVNDAGEVRARVLDLLWIVANEGGAVELDGRPFRGTLYATLDASGKLAVANTLAAEQMLLGIVPAELFPRAPMEALKAQAVTARGEVLAKIGTRHFGEPFRVCAKQHCQVYKGLRQEHPRSTRAVETTRGEILWGEKGLIDTVYSASCGGHTENNDLVWESKPDRHLRGRSDGAGDNGDLSEEESLRRFLAKKTGGYCSRAKIGGAGRYRWTKRVTQGQVAALVARHKNVGAVRAIEVLGRGVSGRVSGVRVVGTRGNVVVKREYPVRTLFGGLYSGMFIVDAEGASQDGVPASFRLRGGGWGHGVGMCQTGAMGMADEGHDFKAILRHYYRNGTVRKLY